ncbi:MAG: PD-(D/E)XK nuclease family transposase [Alphaproteobacteria bacterium]|nr:PD-(D/E)XK nuclease family transposase [Alphaproteobacteria bacterium]
MFCLLSMQSLIARQRDFIFKQIFAEEDNKDLLISFLNSVLQRLQFCEPEPLDNVEINTLSTQNTSIFIPELRKNEIYHLNIIAPNQNVTLLLQHDSTDDVYMRAFNFLAHMMLVPNDQKATAVLVFGENVTARKDAINELVLTFQVSEPDKTSDKARVIFVELPKFDYSDNSYSDELASWLLFLQKPSLQDDHLLKDDKVKTALNLLKTNFCN